VLLTHIEGDFALPSPDPPPAVTGNPEAAMAALRKALEGQAITRTRLPSSVLGDIEKTADKWRRVSSLIAPALTSPGITPGTVVPSVTPSPAVRRSALAAAAAGISPTPQATKPPTKRNVHVELSVAVGVAFPDGTPVVETMEILESQVAKTLNAFEPLFD
jgi:hypothetical protein